MKVMLSWSIEPSIYDKTVKRFLSGKESFPKGVKLLGRWHAAGYGWALLEADQLPKIYTYTNQWAGMVDFQATPVMDDKEAVAALS